MQKWGKLKRKISLFCCERVITNYCDTTIFFAEWISNGRCMLYSTIFFAEWRSNGRFTDEIWTSSAA
jgi:hypothetical protein